MFKAIRNAISDIEFERNSPASPTPPKPFTTDGCSGGMSWFWRKVFGKAPPWEELCVDHDYEYWRGGTWLERLIADVRLFIGVALNGLSRAAMGLLMLGALRWDATLYGLCDLFEGIVIVLLIAPGMFIGVRIGGFFLWPFSWRWGYGYYWPARGSTVMTGLSHLTHLIACVLIGAERVIIEREELDDLEHRFSVVLSEVTNTMSKTNYTVDAMRAEIAEWVSKQVENGIDDFLEEHEDEEIRARAKKVRVAAAAARRPQA